MINEFGAAFKNMKLIFVINFFGSCASIKIADRLYKKKNLNTLYIISYI